MFLIGLKNCPSSFWSIGFHGDKGRCISYPGRIGNLEETEFTPWEEKSPPTFCEMHRNGQNKKGKLQPQDTNEKKNIPNLNPPENLTVHP